MPCLPRLAPSCPHQQHLPPPGHHHPCHGPSYGILPEGEILSPRSHSHDDEDPPYEDDDYLEGRGRSIDSTVQQQQALFDIVGLSGGEGPGEPATESAQACKHCRKSKTRPQGILDGGSSRNGHEIINRPDDHLLPSISPFDANLGDVQKLYHPSPSPPTSCSATALSPVLPVENLNLPGFSRQDSKQNKRKETFHAVIRRAIAESLTGTLSLNEIYDALKNNDPDIALHHPGWKNTTRHCLSIYPCFLNGPKPFSLPGRGGSWSLDANAPESYSRNRSKRKSTNSRIPPMGFSSVASSLPSFKSRRRKSFPLGASAWSSKGRGSFATREQAEDYNETPSNASSFLSSSDGREDDRDRGGSVLGFGEGWEESDERKEHSQRQPSPWMQPQHQQQPFQPSVSFNSLPHPNHSFYLNPRHPTGHSSTIPSYSSTYPPSTLYVPHPLSSDHHHFFPPFEMLRQQGQWNHPPQARPLFHHEHVQYGHEGIGLH